LKAKKGRFSIQNRSSERTFFSGDFEHYFKGELQVLHPQKRGFSGSIADYHYFFYKNMQECQQKMLPLQR